MRGLQFIYFRFWSEAFLPYRDLDWPASRRPAILLPVQFTDEAFLQKFCPYFGCHSSIESICMLLHTYEAHSQFDVIFLRSASYFFREI